MMKDKWNVLYLGLDPSRFSTSGMLTHYPIIQIVPRSHEEILPFFQNHMSWTDVIITSRTALEIFFQIAMLLKIDLAKKRFILVGKATMALLQEFGDFHHLVAKEETAEGIIATLQMLELNERHFFFPHAAKARSLISDFLSPYSFTECILYDTHPTQKKLPQDVNHFDEIVFTSPSTVEAFHQIFGAIPKGKQLRAIGPITQKELDKFR